ncbi:MAG: flagellar protein FlbB [Bradyrhizobiaceae bacterium]|nr:MAG: flagellar protein FlbB [Bradyrhizobiaceae bacterium]
MSFIREFRIIPVLLIAISCLVVLKIAGLLLDGGYIFNDQPVAGKPSWAQATFNFPTGRKAPDGDITGSIETQKEEKKAVQPAIVSPESTRAPDEVVVVPDPNRPVTASERAVLERLQSRRQEIEARGREIDIRENLMKSAEKRIEGKIEEMKAAEARINVATQQRDEAEAARFKGLVTTYENMKPKDAAKVFDRLDISILFDIASQINPRKMSDILGQMQPEAAERLTVEMARRAGGEKSMESNLPKIEGRPSANVN